MKLAVTDDSRFTVILARVFDLDGDTFKDKRSIFEVEASIGLVLLSFVGIEGNAHHVINSLFSGRGRSVVTGKGAMIEPATLSER